MKKSTTVEEVQFEPTQIMAKSKAEAKGLPQGAFNVEMHSNNSEESKTEPIAVSKAKKGKPAIKGDTESEVENELN